MPDVCQEYGAPVRFDKLHVKVPKTYLHWPVESTHGLHEAVSNGGDVNL